MHDFELINFGIEAAKDLTKEQRLTALQEIMMMLYPNDEDFVELIDILRSEADKMEAVVNEQNAPAPESFEDIMRILSKLTGGNL